MKKTLTLIVALFSALCLAEQTKVTGVTQLTLQKLDLSKLTPAQKQHLETYRQIKMLKLNNQYDGKKCFEYKYKPFVLFMSELYPLAMQTAQEYEAKVNEAIENGNKTQQDAAMKRMNICAELAKLCKESVDTYKKKAEGGNTRSLENYMGQYANFEALMQMNGIKYPQRQWLTPTEAELLIRKFYLKQMQEAAAKNAKGKK